VFLSLYQTVPVNPIFLAIVAAMVVVMKRVVLTFLPCLFFPVRENLAYGLVVFIFALSLVSHQYNTLFDHSINIYSVNVAK